MESLPNNRLYVLSIDSFKDYYQCEMDRMMLEMNCDIMTPTTFQEDFQKVIETIDGTLPEYLFWEWVDKTNDQLSLDANRNMVLTQLIMMVVNSIIYCIPSITKIQRYTIPGILLDFDEEFLYVLDIRSDVHVPYPLYSKARRRLYQ